MFNLSELLNNAKNARAEIASLTLNEKNNALLCCAEALIRHTDDILSANSIDIKNAEGKISSVMLDRLMLNSARIKAMADGIKALIPLDDPTNKVLSSFVRDDGLKITKASVPMGVVAIIYESRPNVTSDAASLAFKSGNVCVLRSGSDAICSARAIVAALKEGYKRAGITEYAVNLVDDTSHESATSLMTAKGYVDLLIPRGGKGLISACVKNATVPCIETGTGICHIYVERTADIDKAVKIIENAKTSRPSVCNAEEVLLVDKAIADAALPKIYDALVTKRVNEGKIPVELRLDAFAQSIISGNAAGENDFDTEFLDYILAIKCVDNVDEAIAHINSHSTGHSEAIITSDALAQSKFTSKIDSAAVYVNASTRFTDGGEFGLGCEMGISTQKLHARGPMGLNELTTYKYIIVGDGHIR